MPRGDGTGPDGKGPIGGRGGSLGRGRGRMGGTAAGAGGYCVCPKCQSRVPHQVGQPCYEMECPKCGTPLVRA